MSHTSQRRGLAQDSREIVILCMAPQEYAEDSDTEKAISEFARIVLNNNPSNYMGKSFGELDIPENPISPGLLSWLQNNWPNMTEFFLSYALGRMTNIFTAVFDNLDSVVDVINELKGSWLSENRSNDIQLSVCISSLPGNIEECCQRTGLTEHTFLHSLGYFGNIEGMPTQEELAVVTQCGHGLISVNNLRKMVQDIRNGKKTVEDAAHELARHCVCGIPNENRIRNDLQLLIS